MALLTLIQLHNNEHATVFRVGTQIVVLTFVQSCVVCIRIYIRSYFRFYLTIMCSNLCTSLYKVCTPILKLTNNSPMFSGCQINSVNIIMQNPQNK